ncbi:MAG TPA: hypothetical protein VHA09_03190 [Nitrososphaera sp.]|nr:hypothetical protein [Nitrososphaera sp.]
MKNPGYEVCSSRGFFTGSTYVPSIGGVFRMDAKVPPMHDLQEELEERLDFGKGGGEAG